MREYEGKKVWLRIVSWCKEEGSTVPSAVFGGYVMKYSNWVQICMYERRDKRKLQTVIYLTDILFPLHGDFPLQ